MELQNKNLTERIISAAIRVHKELGPEFLEAMYEEALAIELTAAGLAFERQKLLPVFYREHLIGEHRLDFLVEQQVIQVNRVPRRIAARPRRPPIYSARAMAGSSPTPSATRCSPAGPG